MKKSKKKKSKFSESARSCGSWRRQFLKDGWDVALLNMWTVNCLVVTKPYDGKVQINIFDKIWSAHTIFKCLRGHFHTDLWGWEGSAQAGASEEDTEAGSSERRDEDPGETTRQTEHREESSPGWNGTAAECFTRPGSQWPQICQFQSLRSYLAVWAFMPLNAQTSHNLQCKHFLVLVFSVEISAKTTFSYRNILNKWFLLKAVINLKFSYNFVRVYSTEPRHRKHRLTQHLLDKQKKPTWGQNSWNFRNQ